MKGSAVTLLPMTLPEKRRFAMGCYGHVVVQSIRIKVRLLEKRKEKGCFKLFQDMAGGQGEIRHLGDDREEFVKGVLSSAT